MSVVNALPFKILKTLSVGPLAEVHEVIGPKGPAVLKVAQAEAGAFGEATAPPNLEQGLRFFTGGVGLDDMDPGAVLQAEAAVLKGVDHPAFPQVLDQGEAMIDGRPRRWILLEKINGVTWRGALGSSNPPTPRHVKATADVLAGLAASGQLRWHGDIKPENLMIDLAGKVRILDPTAGMAEVDGDGNPIALLATEAYNPLYLPSDVPALGMLLLELLVGDQPLAAEAEAPPPGRTFTPAAEAWLEGRTVVGHGRMARRLLCLRLPEGAPPALERIALKALCLARSGATLDVVAPYQSVAAFAADLGGALG